MNTAGRLSLLVALLVLTPLVALWSLGDPEAGEYRPVQGLENWDTSIDVSGTKAGKYNLIVKATDAAGNTRYEGPYNVFVDPASDLPVVHISHPTAGARVGTILHVVGTCTDDDGVKSVSVRLDDRDPVTAEGTAFWSFALDVESVPDGEHVLSAAGVDSNGKEGRPESVRFQIDKLAPLIQVSSHVSGSLVADRVTIEGTVEDENGLKSFRWSQDGGSTWEPVRLALDKPGRRGTFRLSLDTRGAEDGPLVLSFRAADRTGSTAEDAFLLFVNNDAPELDILSPADETAASGRVLVTGRGSDKIGLTSLSFDLGGGEAGTIELTAGNPFWTHELDLSGRKAGVIQVTYTLENLAGNRQARKLRLRVDPEADKPLLTLSSPAAGARVSGTVLVTGFVSDDDGIDHVEYALDGGAPAQVPAAAAFGFSLGQIAAGSHRLALRAVDSNGTAGALVEAAFETTGPAPSIAVTALVTAAGSAGFAPGAVLAADNDARLAGTIVFSGSSLKAEYSLQGSEARSLSLKSGAAADQRAFELPLPKGLAPGKVDLSIRATDGFGAVAEYRSFLFVGQDAGGGGIIITDARVTADRTIRLDERPLEGYAGGGAIQTALLDPPTDLLRVDVEGQVFRVSPSGAGISVPTRVTVTTADGSSLSTEPIVFVTDLMPPTIETARKTAGSWVATELSVGGAVTDASGVALLEYTLDEGPFGPVETRQADGSATFDLTLPTSGLTEGFHVLTLRAADKAGNTATAAFPFLKDGIAPAMHFVAPTAQHEVNGLVTIVGRIEDAGAVALVEVTEDGKSWREVGRSPVFHVDVNLSQLAGGPETLALRCTDAAGNTAEARPQLSLDLAADTPVVQIQLPADGAMLRTDSVLSGMVFDDDGVKSIYWRIDDGEFQPLTGANNFGVPLLLERIGDNDHTVEVKAEDIGGLMSEVARARFKVSRSDPLSAVLSPGISDHVREVVKIEGTSADPNGISAVEISFDNGLSFSRASGAESWRYPLDTRLLADGTHAILVRATDSTGAAGMYTTTINVDNRAPDLVIDSPADGQIATDSLRLDGRCLDNIGLASLMVALTPASSGADAQAKTIEAKLSPSGILAHDVDLTSMPSGWYNVQVEAADQAGNRSYVSRNFQHRVSQEAERIELYYPADGERLAGPFSLSGRALLRTATEGKKAVVLVDGQPLETVDLNAEGYFNLGVSAGSLPAGSHTFSAEVVLSQGVRLVSEPRSLECEEKGPWVLISSLAPWDYVTGRPYLKGTAGWSGEPEAQKGEDSPRVRLVEVSTDGGTSFEKAEGRDAWRYRLESQQLPNGELRVMVKATFTDGSTAVTRTQLVVDTRPPTVGLLAPTEGTRFNESFEVVGTAFDNAGLKEISVSLRPGDKSRYQVPSFIQGLYIDLHGMGATYWDAGIGLTFFDANVKLQLQVGMSPLGRFSGFVMGGKLLANIATLPFSYLFGPAWDFFSMSAAVGACFCYFTMSEDTIAFTDEGLVLGGIVGQLELARFDIPRWRLFNTWSLYAEYQLWFISSDVEAGVIDRVAFGMRIGLL